MSARTSIVLFTRDLRVHDNPTLCAAVDDAETVLPVFVLDDAVLHPDRLAPNRTTLLVDALRDLDASLRELGSDGLVIRRGHPAEEVASLAEETGASSVHVSGDWSHLAQCRRAALERALTPLGVDLVVHDDTLVVVAPRAVVPHAQEPFAVFTPYHRAGSGPTRTPVPSHPHPLITPPRP